MRKIYVEMDCHIDGYVILSVGDDEVRMTELEPNGSHKYTRVFRGFVIVKEQSVRANSRKSPKVYEAAMKLAREVGAESVEFPLH